MAVDHAVEFGFRAAMKYEAELEGRCAKVIVDLAGDCFVQILSGFQFNDKSVVDEHVKALCCELFTLVHDSDAELAYDIVPAAAQLPLERHSVHVLEKSISERIVHLIEGADDRVIPFVIEAGPSGSRNDGR